MHGGSGCEHHLGGRMPGSLGARLRRRGCLRLGRRPHIFAWRVRVRAPPGGSGAKVSGSAFDRPCEGAVVCAWGADPAFLHGESVCRHHLEGRVRGSMGARLADLAKSWLFALGAATPRFCMVSPGQTPPGGSGARVNGSAFGRPCEGAVVCAFGGDPTFLHDFLRRPHARGHFLSSEIPRARPRILNCHLPGCGRLPGLPIAKVVTSRCTKGRVCDCFATLPRLSRLPVARIQFRGDAQGGALESQTVLTALPDLHRFCPKQLGRRPAWWAGARSALNSLTGPHTHTAQTGPPECGLRAGITPPAVFPH